MIYLSKNSAGKNTRISLIETMSVSDSEAAFIAFISTFLIVSFLSNVCVVVVMMKIKRMRTVTNIFLSNLAVSDIILTSFVLPQQVHDVSHTDEYFERKLYIVCHRDPK